MSLGWVYCQVDGGPNHMVGSGALWGTLTAIAPLVWLLAINVNDEVALTVRGHGVHRKVL